MLVLTGFRRAVFEAIPPQLKTAIAELQSQGYDLPDYPDSPSTDSPSRR